MTRISGLAVALDTTSVDQAQTWAQQVGPHATLVKLGLEFYLRNGAEGVAQVRRTAPDCGLFLDLKLHDIPATVAGGARAIAELQPDVLTVHAAGGTAMVAAAAAELPDTAIAAVTVLTSLDAAELDQLGLPAAADLVPRWASAAVAAGAQAVVASAQEAASLRAVLGPQPILITPGIRPAGSAANDQARVATPAAAIADGADVLVVGRPITTAADPAAAAAGIAAEIAAAQDAQ